MRNAREKRRLRYTRHGERRANQRGFRSPDIDLVRSCGSIVEDNTAEVYLLRNKDVEKEIRARKQEIQSLERMRGCKVVISDNRLVTAHRCSRRSEKATLRRVS